MFFQSPFYRVFECNWYLLSGTPAPNGESFSPLSIGSLSVTPLAPVNVPTIFPFSPLSIGSLSVTYVAIPRGRFPHFLFQSPFYRVFECNVANKIPLAGSGNPFQSPFYRVFECNENIKDLDVANNEFLSVPFLSGL